MDPAIEAILGHERTRTTYCLDIQTPAARRWTNFPRPLTVQGLLYSFIELEVGAIVETADGSTALSCEVAIQNLADGIATPLVADAVNQNAPIVIRRVWFDPALSLDAWAADPTGSIEGSEVWLDGKIGLPRFEGSSVIFTATADLGRRGKSPAYRSADVMRFHRPPEPGAKLGWYRLEVRR